MNDREQIRVQDVIQARQGDREAFVGLMRQLETGMYVVAKSMVSHDDIADVLQETIIKALQSLDTLREPAFFKTWVYRILINECHAVLRRRSRTAPLDAIPEIADHRDETSKVELRMAIGQLEQQQRLIVTLYYFQDMPIQEVADTLQITAGAAKTRLHRARKALMDVLGYQEEGGQLNESF